MDGVIFVRLVGVVDPEPVRVVACLAELRLAVVNVGVAEGVGETDSGAFEEGSTYIDSM